MVIINKGICAFDFILDASEDFSYCPMCSEQVQPTKYGFNRCEWKIRGAYTLRKRGFNKLVEQDFVSIKDSYQLFDFDFSIPWLTFAIVTRPNSFVNNDKSTVDKVEYIELSKTHGETCAICLSDIKHEDEWVLPCNHVFHSDCINKWLHSGEDGAELCPLCREDISLYS
ncbi:unnamed protein product [Didymodactylos carnosus]|uniref:RING-type domain-containing protein n=1 Tax=Didymodactylos carnosus TaxID=1234261 RepID=A0A814XA35_9BILA|nr:unnamed protein product [Didymodactylos carnosus]CAF1484292.1 unnamed protein product [Didymodactylos carnosus]CAF3978931.1 unnamed protein product [Didymodactylos carnosus]CAF4274394.1 unnamed protein product [Didymodactylos carnosus]